MDTDEEPVTIKASCSDIEHILTNLFVNGLDALEPGKGRIDITTKVKKDPAVVVITVRDNGPGIPQEDLARIFDPFYTTKEVGHGTGLGLAVVYNLVQDNEGDINVYNDDGAVFEIILPLKVRI